MGVLLKALNDPSKLMMDLESLSAICIQDLGFYDSHDLESFLSPNLDSDDRLSLHVRLGYLLDHYGCRMCRIRTPSFTGRPDADMNT